MSDTFDLKNHFCLQHTEQLKAINKPLDILGIDSFCFTSIDLITGKRFILTDHPAWTHYAYNSGFYGIELVRKIETSGFLETFLWSDFAHNKGYSDSLKTASQFGLCHGITFIQHTSERLNMYYAGTSNQALGDQHISNVGKQILDFIPYFHASAKDIIKDSLNHQFAVRTTTPEDNSTLDPSLLQQFYEAIEIKQLVINDSGDYLTHQEALCVYLIFCGKSIQQISIVLAISVRTVEKHIANIRKKVNLKPQENLITKLFDSIYLNHIMFYGKRFLG